MTFVRAFAPLRSVSRQVSRPIASFHTSAARFVHSEADRGMFEEHDLLVFDYVFFAQASFCLLQTNIDSHKDSPDRDQKIDHHKKDSVDKAKSGKGEWKPELASSSEQAVSGDKNNMSMEEMQKLGEKQAEQGKTPSGSSSSDKHWGLYYVLWLVKLNARALAMLWKR